MRCEFPMTSIHDSFRAARRDFENRMSERVARPTNDLSVFETENEIQLHLDLPGVSEDTVNITLHDGLLTISGSRASVVPDDAEAMFVNRRHGDFERQLRIDDSIDPESLDAVIQLGVLQVTMKRRPELQPRKINIRAAQ